jgi:hypothetical protein
LSTRWRLVLSGAGAAVLVATHRGPVGDVLAGTPSARIWPLAAVVGALLLFAGLAGGFPDYDRGRLSEKGPDVSWRTLLAIFMVALWLLPAAGAPILFDVWASGRGYESRRARGQTKWERRLAPTEYVRKEALPKAEPSPTREAVDPPPARAPLFVTWDLDRDGVPTQAQIKELLETSGAVGVQMSRDMTPEEAARFCGQSRTGDAGLLSVGCP